MSPRMTLCAAARVLLLVVLAATPLALGRLSDWETFALLLAVSLAGTLWVVGGGGLCGPGDVAERLLAAGFLGAVIITPWSVYLYDSLRVLSLLLGGLHTFALARVALGEPVWRMRGWWALVAGGVAAGLWGAREYTSSALAAGNLDWRAFGPFYNPNCLGGYMALLLLVPLALALGAQTRSRSAPIAKAPSPPIAKRRQGSRSRPPTSGRLSAEAPPPRYPEIAGVTAMAVLGLGLLCTGSKGAMLAALSGAVVFGLLGAERGSGLARGLRWAVVGLVLCAVVAAIAFPPLRSRLTAAFGSQQHSGSFRLYTWQGTLDMICARPLTGFGPGTFAHAYPRFARAGFTRQAHETPLQLAAENGVPAAILLLCGMGAVLLAVAHRASRETGRERLLAAAALGGAIAFWVHNLVDYTWYVAAFQAGLWALLGLALPRESEGTDPPVARSPRWAVLALLVVLVGWSGSALRSELELASGTRLLHMGAVEAAQTRLVHVLPLNAGRWVQLSRAAEYQARNGDRALLQEAVNLRRKAIALQPTEPTNYVSLGRLLADLGDLVGAERACREAVAVHPTSTEALAALAGAQRALGNGPAALDTYRRLVALYDTPVRTSQAVEYSVDDNYAHAWSFLASDASTHGDRARVLQFATKGLRVAVEYVRSQRAYRQMLEVGGRFDEQRVRAAERVAEDLIALLRGLNQPLADVRAGAALVELGRCAEAEPILRAVAERPGGVHEREANLLRAWALMRLADCLTEDHQAEQASQLHTAGARLWAQLTSHGGSAATRPAGWDSEDEAAVKRALEGASQTLQPPP